MDIDKNFQTNEDDKTTEWIKNHIVKKEIEIEHQKSFNKDKAVNDDDDDDEITKPFDDKNLIYKKYTSLIEINE